MTDPKLVFLDASGGDADSASAALRERAATTLESALGFVVREGDALSLARAHAILRAEPAQAVADVLLSAQQGDGSFPRLPPGPGEVQGLAAAIEPTALAGTVDALSALGDLRCLHAAAVESAVGFATNLQNQDGSWGGTDAEASARLHTTGRLGSLLARTPYVRPEHLGRAGDFLGEHWAPERVEGGHWDALSGYAAFFSNVPHDLSDEGLQWCGRELERGFRSRRFEALPVARVLLDCDAGALPGFGVGPAELLSALLDEQAGDGGFAELAAAAPSLRVGASLDGMLAVIGLCAGL